MVCTDGMLLFLSLCHFFRVFFFKQKTAYEMRISDWSSDVCSSDLAASQTPHTSRLTLKNRPQFQVSHEPIVARSLMDERRFRYPSAHQGERATTAFALLSLHREVERKPLFRSLYRSEEHTSELQSLMRISYAVFCLKQKKNIINYYPTTHI